MFKYLRTLNTEFHPTVVEFYVSEMIEGFMDHIERGNIVSLSEGKISGYYIDGQPLYLTLESKNDDETKTIKCMRLTPNMILECDLGPEASASNIYVGSLLDVAVDVDSKAVGVELAENAGAARFEALDTSELSDGKLTVVII